MRTVSDLYPLWRKQLITETRLSLNKAEFAVNSWANPESVYWRSIAAIVALKRQALAIYESSPEKLE